MKFPAKNPAWLVAVQKRWEVSPAFRLTRTDEEEQSWKKS